MGLNLWSWRTADRQQHLGVSAGPQMDDVLDLSLIDPALRSVHALWMKWREPEKAAQELTRALLAEVRRITLEGQALDVPVEVNECWAAGVTYESSRDARVEETEDAEQFYRRVYGAKRPEIFFKAPGSRVVGPDAYVGLRRDSQWQVPEPELTVIIDPTGGVFGYTVGNDMSSRDIEGENPLYLPQAKIFHNSAAIGPSLVLHASVNAHDMTIAMNIKRDSQVVFHGAVNTRQMRRTVNELVDSLFHQWPVGGWTALMTGTALVPDAPFSLQDGDEIAIAIDGIGTLRNTARRIAPDWVPLRPRRQEDE